MKIDDVLATLLTEISNLQKNKPLPIRVAVNGIESSGKTTFAVQLVAYLKQHSCNAIHVTIDGYHNPKAIRYQQGRDSAQGYYEDAYDEAAFVENVLVSSQQSEPNYVPKIHDLETDQYVKKNEIPISPQTVLVIDGAYLSNWDYKIYLDVQYDVARGRGVMRDAALLGGEVLAEDKYLKRYHAAAELYESEVKPKLQADIIIDNSDFLHPRIIENKSSHPVH